MTTTTAADDPTTTTTTSTRTTTTMNTNATMSTNTIVVFKIAESDEDILACYPVLRQLRDDQVLDATPTEFVANVRKQQQQYGYRLVSLQIQQQAQAPPEQQRPVEKFNNDEQATPPQQQEKQTTQPIVVVAVAGYCIRENFAMGQHVYVLDLVTDSSHRSLGYGAQLLRWLEKRSTNGVVLDSGFARTDAHRFYQRHGFRKIGYLFSSSKKHTSSTDGIVGVRDEDGLRHSMDLFHNSLFRTIVVLLAITVLFCLQRLDRPLRLEPNHSSTSPYGMVSFQCAGSLERAHAILSSWANNSIDNYTILYATLSLGIDYVFLLLYPIILAIVCEKVAIRYQSKKHTSNTTLFCNMGYGIAKIQFIAGMLDGIENYALIRLLLGSSDGDWPVLAMYCAYTKFAMIACAIAYILIGMIMILITKSSPSTTTSVNTTATKPKEE